MFSPDQYQLLDFGSGRKLERFGEHVVDRPAPAAGDAAPHSPDLWSQADAVFERSATSEGCWNVRRQPEDWIVRCGQLAFELRLGASGQVGLFPEHAVNWQWLARRLEKLPRAKVLNLFAYTGGTTLAAAQAGAEVVHVDASTAAIATARRNAQLSGLAERPIRWIEDDVLTLVRREIRRENRYQAIILDPPSYGHGPKGQPWKLASHLDELLTGLAMLIDRQDGCVLLSCHTPGYGPWDLVAALEAALGSSTRGAPLELIAADGRRLPSGSGAVWTAQP